MIIGIGSDVISIPRIEKMLERFGQRFIDRVYTLGEQQGAAKFGPDNSIGKAAYYAKRFAAKEAFSKALGIGFRNGLAMKHIEVSNDKVGKPICALVAGAEHYAGEAFVQNNVKVHVSLSDDYPVAQAMVIVEAV
jgi:holo-[acyl-carrier protein] synthase